MSLSASDRPVAKHRTSNTMPMPPVPISRIDSYPGISMFSSAYLKAKRTCCYVCDRVALRCRDGTAESDVSLRQKVGLLTDQLTVRMYGSQASALNQVIKLYGGRFRLVQNRLKAILVVGFYVRDFFQCSLELFPIEESGATRCSRGWQTDLRALRTRTLPRRHGPWLQAQRRAGTNPRVLRYSCSYPLSFYSPQKLARCQHLNSKPLNTHEMADVMRDNRVRVSSYG